MLLNMAVDSRVPAFTFFGPTPPVRAVVFSVPHGGRYYPPELLAAARVPTRSLEKLEDRYADRLVDGLDEQGWSGIVAQWARAWIDLNRSEKEVDSTMVIGRPLQFFSQPSEKVRGGLGLFPRRLGTEGDLWRTRFDWTQLLERVDSIYRPYHRALETLMDCAVKQHGVALLLDVHSMPSLSGVRPAQIVIGDRNGASAPEWLSDLIMQCCRKEGFRAVRNRPYAGGHIAERHGRIHKNRYAVQIEIDRALYLDGAGEVLDGSISKIQKLLERIANNCADRLEHGGSDIMPIAAE